jgi:hypothetical protein
VKDKNAGSSIARDMLLETAYQILDYSDPRRERDYKAWEWSRAHELLDRLNVPKQDASDRPYSLWGRIAALAKMSREIEGDAAPLPPGDLIVGENIRLDTENVRLRMVAEDCCRAFDVLKDEPALLKQTRQGCADLHARLTKVLAKTTFRASPDAAHAEVIKEIEQELELFRVFGPDVTPHFVRRGDLLRRCLTLLKGE